MGHVCKLVKAQIDCELYTVHVHSSICAYTAHIHVHEMMQQIEATCISIDIFRIHSGQPKNKQNSLVYVYICVAVYTVDLRTREHSRSDLAE